jgi:hypothetical protein
MNNDLLFLLSAGISGAVSASVRNNMYANTDIRKNDFGKLLGCGGSAALGSYILRNYVQHPHKKVTKSSKLILDGILLGMWSGLITNELISTTDAQELVAVHTESQ